MSKRPLRGKVCGWCEQPLEQAARGHCGAIYRDFGFSCFWVAAIREHGAEGALKRGRVSSEESVLCAGVQADPVSP
jgi:hypothetical protein